MQKQLLTFILILICSIPLLAQLRLNVQGDAQITGRLELWPTAADTTSLLIGKSAGKLADFSAERSNTFVGNAAGLVNTSGYFNTFLGAKAGDSNTSGFSNTFLGALSGSSNTEGEDNVFLGTLTGFNNSLGSFNTFLGTVAGFANLTGASNTFVGYGAGNANTTGSSNVAVGKNALWENKDRSGLVAVGDSALYNNGLGATLMQHGTQNTALGSKAGFSNTTGSSNTFVGNVAGYGNKSGVSNAFFGFSAGRFTESGSYNTFLGPFAGNRNGSGNHNTFVGLSAGASNTSGNYNTFLGSHAGSSNKTGYSNVAIGRFALRENTVRSDLVAVGDSALFNNVDGHSSVAIGSKAGFSNQGDLNTFIGFQAGKQNIDGRLNTFLGANAGLENTSGRQNTFIGHGTGRNNESGSQNTFLGISAGSKFTSGINNTFVGHQAGLGDYAPEGSSNTFLGAGTGRIFRSGSGNTFIGSSAGYYTDTASYTISIGYRASAFGNLAKAVAIGYKAWVGCSYCIVLGGEGADAVKVGIGVRQPTTVLSLLAPGALNPVGITQGQIGAGSTMEFTTIDQADAQATRLLLRGDNNDADIEFYRGPRGSETQTMIIEGTNGQVGIGTNIPDQQLHVIGNIHTSQTVIEDSDERLKTNIRPIRQTLDKIRQVQAVSFSRRDQSVGRRYGFIAQNLEKAFPEIVHTNEAGFKSVAYSRMTAVLLAGIQEQQEEIEDLEKDVDVLRHENGALKKENQAINARMNELESLVRQLLAQNQDQETINSQTIELQREAKLYQNRPNPFEEQTAITYYVPEGITKAQLRITAPDGKLLRLVDVTGRGPGQTILRTRNLPAGAYAYSLLVDGHVFDTRQMIIQ